MKLPLLSTTLSVLWLVAGGVSTDAHAAPTSASATVVAKNTYQPGSAESSYITVWIERNSPAYAPVRRLGKITIQHTYGDSGRAGRSGMDGTPAPLPTHGSEGEEVTITSRHPDGPTETWGYTWQEGGWKLGEYHFKGATETSQPPVGG
ncbi:hypothetical protein [Stenotrophomonas sp.]|uniref:hypothetical protein n=1 Tax=Stenotrophomonas sp. TaxID=69392 RepID=UPI002FCBC563